MIVDKDKNTCDSKAYFAVPWAGKIQLCCKDHANQLRFLGDVIGQPLQVSAVFTDQDCYLKDTNSHPKEDK